MLGFSHKIIIFSPSLTQVPIQWSIEAICPPRPWGHFKQITLTFHIWYQFSLFPSFSIASYSPICLQSQPNKAFFILPSALSLFICSLIIFFQLVPCYSILISFECQHKWVYRPEKMSKDVKKCTHIPFLFFSFPSVLLCHTEYFSI